MEPEDNQRFSQSPKMTMQLSSNNSDYFRSVQQVQTSKCRRRKRISEMAEFPEEHQCSSSAYSRSTIFSSSPLVLFLLTSALVLFMCVSPSHSLPFDGRSLSSSGGGSHRSQVDLLIDPIHQAEYGDDDPFENTRVVKSVFDMVLRTPPPPTSSSNRCPPGTQSPYDGAPCIKKSTDPVAFVDQSFLLDTLRGLTQKGELLGGRQKNRRPGGGPGSNRRRTSGRPGLRTSTTTPAPSTTLSSEDEEGEMSPTASTFGSSDISATGDISNVNVVEEDMGAITQEPSTSTPLETTLAPSSEGDEAETVMPVNEASASSSEQLSVVETTMAPQQSTEAPVTTTVEAVTTTSTTVPTTTSTTTTTEAPVIKNGADLRRTAAPEESLLPSASALPPVPSSSSLAESSTENGKKSSPSSSSNNNSYYSSFQFPFLSPSSYVAPLVPQRQQPQAADHSSSVADDKGQSEIFRYYNTRNVNNYDDRLSSIRNYYSREDNNEYPLLSPSYTSNYQRAAGMPSGLGRRRYASPGYNPGYYYNYNNGRRSRRRMLRTL